jgi:hypothetical protein
MNPQFEFTDPPLRHSLPVVLALAATAGRPAAVLTGSAAIAGPPPGVIRLPRLAGTGDIAPVSTAGHPLTAAAALAWHGDLPRPLQQIFFDTADGVTPPPPASLSRAGWSAARSRTGGTAAMSGPTTKKLHLLLKEAHDAVHSL